MAARVRKAYRRKRSLHWKIRKLHIIKKQMMWWICLDSALAGAECVTEFKMSRHLEIQTFGRTKAPFTKTHRFPDLDCVACCCGTCGQGNSLVQEGATIPAKTIS